GWARETTAGEAAESRRPENFNSPGVVVRQSAAGYRGGCSQPDQNPLESTAMAISAAKISSLCNNSEILLVRASRPPELNHLSQAELKRLAARTRKLADKWLGQYRSQARIRSRQTGSGAAVSNTRLKAQVFSDAFRKMQARL